MNTVITVVVVAVLLGMLVMMVKYARFIHHYPGEQSDEQKQGGKEDSAPGKPDGMDGS